MLAADLLILYDFDGDTKSTVPRTTVVINIPAPNSALQKQKISVVLPGDGWTYPSMRGKSSS